MKKLRVGIFGNNEVGIGVLALLNAREDVDIVVLIPEGKDIVKQPIFWERPFLLAAINFANEQKKLCFVGDINKYDKELSQLNLDLLIGCRSQALVKKKILDIPKIGVTNLHYGELPKYGGCSTIQHALLNGEDHIGVTLHFMDEIFDNGPIIAQQNIEVGDTKRVLSFLNRKVPIYGKTAFELYREANEAAISLFAKSFDKIKNKVCYDQDNKKRLYFTHDKLDFDKDMVMKVFAVLDLDDLKKIRRHALAFTFPPKQLPVFRCGSSITSGLIREEVQNE